MNVNLAPNIRSKMSDIDRAAIRTAVLWTRALPEPTPPKAHPYRLGQDGRRRERIDERRHADRATRRLLGQPYSAGPC